MCGRLNVIDNPLCRTVCEQVGTNFKTTTTHDLRPAQDVPTVGIHNNELVQLDLSWGIKPSWAKRIIINAQAETAAVKPTFAQAFEFNRVIVPCSGWDEWREEQDNKVKYLFYSENLAPFYIAGIALEGGSKLVTLTTRPNEQCNGYHHRMPLLIPDDSVMTWLSRKAEEAFPLLSYEYQGEPTISTD